MKKGEVSRAKLVTTTGELLQRQGYHATGLSEIIEESGAPRGSVYFYFPGGKEDLAVEALEASGNLQRVRLEAVIERAANPGEAAQAVCQLLADDLAASKFAHGCPIATVALEAASTSERVRKACAAQFAGWEKLIAKKLVAEGVDPSMAEAVSSFVLSTVEGASMLSRVRRDVSPLVQAGALMNSLFHTLQSKRTKRSRSP